MGSRRRLAVLTLLALLGAGIVVTALLRDDEEPAPGSPGDATRDAREDESGGVRLQGRGIEGEADVQEPVNADAERDDDLLVKNGDGRVTGLIVGPDGRPVVGATAGYDAPRSNDLRAAEADAEGRFELVRSAGHAFTVVAVAPGHCIALGPRVHLQAGQTVDVGTLRLVGGFAIGGSIVDLRGEPAVDVEIAIETEADPVPETWARMCSANEAWRGHTTDEAGRFVFDHLPEGVYRVMVAYGVSDTWDEVREHVPTGTDDLCFVAPVAARVVDARIRVRAVGPDAAPIPRFQVRLNAADGSAASGWARGGELSIGSKDMVAPVRLTLWDAHGADGKRFGYGVAIVPSVEAREEPYVVRLEPAGHVAGRVLWNGEPRTWLLQATGRVDTNGHLVRDSQPGTDKLPFIRISMKSDTSGAFRFDGLPPGEVAIGLQGGGGSFRLEGREVVAHVGRNDVVLRLVATGSIRIRLHAPEGNAIRRGAANLVQYVAGGVASAGSSSASSSRDHAYFDFLFRELDLEGKYRLESSVVAAGRTYTGTVLDGISPREEPYQVHVEEGLSISGRVTRRGGSPVQGAVVHYRPCPAGCFDPGLWVVGEKRHGTATTGQDGSFELTGLDPGEVVLTVGASGLTLVGPQPPVSAGARSVSLVVGPARRISGHVEDDAGGRVDDLCITAIRAEGDVGLWSPYDVTADGFFEVQGLHEGAWRIVGWNSERDDDPRFVLSEPVAAGTKDVRLAVRRGTVLTGFVRNADGMVIPGSVVRLVCPWTNRRYRTRNDGAFVFAGVPPGSYVLEVRLPLGGEARRSFTAKADSEKLQVDVVVP